MRLPPATALALILAPAAYAQSGTVSVKPETLIAARQSAFALSAGTFQGMKEAIKDQEPVRPWADLANELADWAALIPDMFPAGTEKGHDTHALAAVWSDRAGFEKAARTYHDAALKLAAAAKEDDKSAFAAAFKETGKACGACHKTYRQKE